MSGLLDLPFMKEAVTSCHLFWEMGWGECHAGNMSYLLDDDQIAEFEPYFMAEPVSVAFPYDTVGLVGRTFLVTRSGGQFRTIVDRAELDLGVIRMYDDHYDILWGLENGVGRPTSELPAHLLCHAARLKSNPDNRLVMHTHPTYLNAMTTIADLDEETFTKTLWSLNSECILVFPDGIGMLPWMICGEGPIGPATAKKMEQYRIVVWPYHGILSAGNSFDEAIGIIETVDKNAHVYVAVNGQPKQRISDAELAQLAAHFNLTPAFEL